MPTFKAGNQRQTNPTRPGSPAVFARNGACNPAHNGVYRFPHTLKGLAVNVFYHVSEYEGKTKRRLHLFHRITNVCEEEIDRLHNSNFFKTDPVKTWIKAIDMVFRQFVYMWFIDWF